MKRFAVITLIAVLILTLASPVFALNDQPKFDRESYFYAKAEWTTGDPYGEEPYEVIEFEIGRYNNKLDEIGRAHV